MFLFRSDKKSGCYGNVKTYNKKIGNWQFLRYTESLWIYEFFIYINVY